MTPINELKAMGVISLVLMTFTCSFVFKFNTQDMKQPLLIALTAFFGSYGLACFSFLRDIRKQQGSLSDKQKFASEFFKLLLMMNYVFVFGVLVVYASRVPALT